METYRGTTVQMSLSDKVRFEIAVSDAFVDHDRPRCWPAPAPARSATARSIVVPSSAAIRIRTGESDEMAVTPVAA